MMNTYELARIIIGTDRRTKILSSVHIGGNCKTTGINVKNSVIFKVDNAIFVLDGDGFIYKAIKVVPHSYEDDGDLLLEYIIHETAYIAGVTDNFEEELDKFPTLKEFIERIEKYTFRDLVTEFPDKEDIEPLLIV